MRSDREAGARTDPTAAEVPVTALKGVGPRLAERLARLRIHTVQDVLFHLPYRYQDRTRVLPLGSLRPGDQAVIEAEVQLAEVRFGRRRSLLVRLADGTGQITLRFFHFSAAQQAGFTRGARVRCFGEVRPGAATLEMIHPEYERLDGAGSAEVAAHLTPLYPATEGVHQLTLRKLTETALDWLEAHPQGLTEWLPEAVRSRFAMPDLRDAVRYIHRPPPGADVAALEAGTHPVQQRLAFEELLAHHLSLRALRERKRSHRAPPLEGDGRLREAFLAALPFVPTAAQTRVGGEIARDLARDHPMLRLVQGDVGSGKTLVAALAALQAVEAGWQVAVMAPTELLAEQHWKNFTGWLEPLGVRLGWLGGRRKGRARTETLEGLAGGRIQVAVGTHALFQEEVRFARLGLVIVDEQHRFGVHQRLALRDKGGGELRPHQLTLTATPIPRTLAMAMYADLDTSVIDELPPGRTPVVTVAIPDSRRAEVVQRVADACARGRQAYWVCTLIEESEVLAAEAAEATAASLAGALPQLRVGLVHGRMKAADKEGVMAAFKAAELDLLVATTVIEVGVDVPNASLMIIENAERLGLAQLHQLRGRVGRGSEKSSCVLLYHPPLSRASRERLAVMRETSDGFVIAQRDLELRGPGEVLGTRQTGLVAMRVADLVRDRDQLDAVEAVADTLLKTHPEHVTPLVRRWLGDATRYGAV